MELVQSVLDRTGADPRRLKLELTDSESAAVFRTEDGYIYIVMPLSRDR